MAPLPDDEDPGGKVALWEVFLIRLFNVPVVLAARAADVLLLALRPRLLRAYFGLWLQELWRSPYRWPRSFEAALRLQASGQRRRELMFGEMPVFTAAWVLWRAGLRREGALLDLGAGRGRPLLGARWLGAGARGLELLPEHVRAAAPFLARAGAALEEADALEAELGSPTHVLLNWCAFTDRTKERLAHRLQALRPGTVLVAVTVPLDPARFPLVTRYRGLFTWGFERIYVHRVPPATPST